MTDAHVFGNSHLGSACIPQAKASLVEILSFEMIGFSLLIPFGGIVYNWETD